MKKPLIIGSFIFLMSCSHHVIKKPSQTAEIIRPRFEEIFALQDKLSRYHIQNDGGLLTCYPSVNNYISQVGNRLVKLCLSPTDKYPQHLTKFKNNF